MTITYPSRNVVQSTQTTSLEGPNNKIKLLIHRAFGSRSADALMAMIHLCCSGIVIDIGCCSAGPQAVVLGQKTPSFLARITYCR